MSEFKQYRRTQIAEMRHVTKDDIAYYEEYKQLVLQDNGEDGFIEISISYSDRENGSPKIGDMIARNPKNHEDQWLVAKQYFKNNFEVINE